MGTHLAGPKEDDEHAAKGHGPAHTHPETHAAHEEHEEGEPWLLSYADMVTLLMCFFILFFQLDKSKGGLSSPERLKRRLESSIAVDPAMLSETSGGDAGAPPDQSKTSSAEARRGLSSDLQKISGELKVVFALSYPDPETVKMTFLSTNFFKSGSADLSDDAKRTLKTVGARIKALQTPELEVDVSGHTDSSPVTTSRFPSNWELSAARAAVVGRTLIEEGVSPKTLKISGFADQRPVLPEKDRRGVSEATARQVNRRVEIKLVFHHAQTPAQKETSPAKPH